MLVKTRLARREVDCDVLQGSALTNFLLRKTGKNWDSVPLENVSVDDLDKESFDIFHREAIFNALIH